MENSPKKDIYDQIKIVVVLEWKKISGNFFILPLFISQSPGKNGVFQFLPLLIIFTTALPGTERNRTKQK